jgi:hypothetical protein
MAWEQIFISRPFWKEATVHVTCTETDVIPQVKCTCSTPYHTLLTDRIEDTGN